MIEVTRCKASMLSLKPYGSSHTHGWTARASLKYADKPSLPLPPKIKLNHQQKKAKLSMEWHFSPTLTD